MKFLTAGDCGGALCSQSHAHSHHTLRHNDTLHSCKHSSYVCALSLTYIYICHAHCRHTHIYMYTHVHTQTRYVTHTGIHTLHKHTNSQLHTNMCNQINMHTHTPHTHTHIHTHTHTHTHTLTHLKQTWQLKC